MEIHCKFGLHLILFVQYHPLLLLALTGSSRKGKELSKGRTYNFKGYFLFTLVQEKLMSPLSLVQYSPLWETDYSITYQETAWILDGCPRTFTITHISRPQKSCLGLKKAEAQYHRLRKMIPLVHDATHVHILCIFDNPCYFFDVYQHVVC